MWVKKRSKQKFVVLFFLITSQLVGCGFHLKGLQDQTPVSIHLDYDKVSASFRQEFRQVLSQNPFLEAPAKLANVNVIFLKERWQRQSLSVADDGKPAEYRLLYFLSYRFIKRGVEKFEEISESREFKANNAQLLAVESEQILLKQQIQQATAMRVLWRIR